MRAANGDLDVIDGVANLKEALTRRLLTTPGSLVHRPTYGVGIKDYHNAVGDLENQRTLALRVKEQFEQDDRVDSVEGLRFDILDERPNELRIFIKVNIRGFREVEFDFVPFGGGGVT